MKSTGRVKIGAGPVVGVSRLCVTGVCAAFAVSAAPESRGDSLEPATLPALEQAQTAPATAPAATEFKGMSLDELMNVEVTSVSRRSEKLSEAPSAIQVITGDDIQRSGAISLPEALRLAPNLQVAQANAHDWSVTARGFNGAPSSGTAFGDKLLVMIDGRTVYTPLFAGVFWDVQNVLLEDVDRIEVISGPGGTLWGANAVNGVINVVSKSAKDTQGLYVSGGGGTFWQDAAAVRYGGSVGENLYYRVYTQRFDHNSTDMPNGDSAHDQWGMTQGGFRMDYLPSESDTFTLQGDYYEGDEGEPTATETDGQNLLGRWTHTFSEQSSFVAQTYFDRTWRNLPTEGSADQLTTYDLDLQHSFALGDNNNILWGAGYRLMEDHTRNVPAVSFLPAHRAMQLFSAFVQDEITIVPDRLKATVGTKIEHNDFTGYELEPSGRLAWTPTKQQTVWAAISRAVRTPSRLDTDEVYPTVSTPGGAFVSEKLVAYELGYRVRPADTVSLSLATYYNHYTDLRSFDFDPTGPTPFIFANDQKADAWGVELSGEWRVLEGWRLRGGYNYMDKRISSTNPEVVPVAAAEFEADDPHNQVSLQSIMDLPMHLRFDMTARYVEALPSPHIPGYITFDARVAWQYKNIEVSVEGQNLGDNEHPEFGALQIPRSVFGKVTLRF